MQGHANILWVCMKESTVKKLMRFAKIFNLRLDSIYLVSYGKNNKIATVSYQPVESEYDLLSVKVGRGREKEEKKMIVFSGVNVERC